MFGLFLVTMGCARLGARVRTGTTRKTGLGKLAISKATVDPMASMWVIREANDMGEQWLDAGWFLDYRRVKLALSVRN